MRNILRIMNVARSQWRWMALGIFASVFVMVANSLLMAVSGWFIASMAVAGVSKASFNYFIPSAAIRLFAISRTVGRYLERLVTHDAALRILSELRVWLFLRFAPLSPAVLERYSTGELSSRFRNDIDTLENLYLRIFAPVAAGVVAIIASTIFVGIWNIFAAAALLFFLVLSGLVIPAVARSMASPHAKRGAVLSGDLRRVMTDGVAGGDELILLGAVEKSVQSVNRISAELVDEQKNLALKGGIVSSWLYLSSGCGAAVLLVINAFALVSGEMNGPQLVMLLLFCAASFEAAGGISSAMMLFPSVAESASRINSLADAQCPVNDPREPSRFIDGFSLRMEDVSFSYDGENFPLKKFSLDLPYGSRVALTGESGAGKSTVIELLLRFREYEGSITFGGVELKALCGDDIRSSISALSQKSHIFNSTVRENILVAKPDASGEEIAAVIHAAALDEWIAELPDGLETRTGEGGSEISGGEARRVALARTLLKQAELYILDEPTEGVDAVTESKLVARIDQYLKGKSLLLVSHRPALLRIVDRIQRVG